MSISINISIKSKSGQSVEKPSSALFCLPIDKENVEAIEVNEAFQHIEPMQPHSISPDSANALPREIVRGR